MFVLNSCASLSGIQTHYNVTNPEKPVTYPKFNKEIVLLGELTPLRENFDVTFYDLDIFIDYRTKKLSGWVGIKSIAVTDIDSIQIDLDQRFEINELRWQNRDGKTLKYKRDQRAVFIKLEQKVKQGEAFTIHVKYEGKPVVALMPPWLGGTVWKTDALAKPWIGVACEKAGASVWFPCKDHTSDEADSVKTRFTIPKYYAPLKVVSNGQFLGVEENKVTGEDSFSWKVSYPINTYNITFYVGDFVKIEDSYTTINSKTVKLNHYVLRQNVEKATKHFQQVKEHIKVFEELYGEYPWINDGFRLVESPYAGMEHQSSIAYGNGYKNDINGTDDHIILHEAGHEWFGNAISVADLADVWIQEGFTTYGEALYLEKRYGYSKYLSHLLKYRIFIKNARPVVGVYDRRFFDYRDSDVYMKGAWILHSLRTTIDNDSLFFSCLKTFYNKYKLKITNSQDFIETVNQVTAKDYKWFFDQYLYKNKVPVLEYQYIKKTGGFYYRWLNVSDNFKGLPIRIKFDLMDDYSVIYPTNRTQKFSGVKWGEIFVNNSRTLFGKKKNRELKVSFKKQNTK